MSGILDLLNSSMGKELINGASQQMGLNKASTASALGAAMPLILGAMKNNSSTSSGAAGLLGALGNSSHNGSMLDNLGSILGGSNIDDDVMTDGGNILGHVFGGQENNAASAISKSSGIDMNSAMNMMKVAAPFIMSYLGKQTMSNSVSDQNGLSGLLGGLLGNDGGTQQDMASKIQGFDNNDFSIDDIAGLMTGGGKSDNILGTLGKLFS
ncbi:MAG: DUF937 domain-containing protein [Flavobacteriaceae bacterium]|nr:DUF937 domain-containing protein [Flavobacteriaceae bacterium]